MSSGLLRRNSSKQGLQNLLRVTAQRSIEDAEEIERERRRRAREAFRSESGLSGSTGSPQESAAPAEACLYDEGDFKPSSSLSLEEDEGFSDWTQRMHRSRRSKPEENGHKEEEEEMRSTTATSRQLEKTSMVTSSTRLQRAQKEEDEEKEEDRQSHSARGASERRREFGMGSHSQRDGETDHAKKREDDQSEMATDQKKEMKVSYTSKVFLQQDRMATAPEEASAEGVTSNLTKVRRTPRGLGQAPEVREEVVEACLETEQKLEKIRRSHQEKESQELEQLRQKQVGAEAELEELKKRREERRRIREEEERRKEEEEQQRLSKEEGERRRMKEDIEKRRMEAAEKRMKSLNTSGSNEEEMFNPLSPKSPTFKITERTESLNRSLKKSNSFKKTQPPVLLSKIDDKLEQYTHAIESSFKEPKVTKPGAMDMPSVPEPVASKKSLFEAGEAWNQNSPKGTASKDTEALKVGVADLITQWVRVSPEGGSRGSPSRPADVKAGDVLQKKNMWEIIGEGSSAGRTGSSVKGNTSGKRYKFVVTGHGKYEKIAGKDENYSDYTNGKSDDLCQDAY